MKRCVTVAFLFLFLSACSLFERAEDKDCNPFPTSIDYESRVTIQQGIGGRIWFWEGDFMPPIGCDSGTIEPVSREVFIYELTSFDQVVPRGVHSFYSEVKTQLVATVRSDENGFFEITLPRGTYSIFVKEDGRFYAFAFDLSEGHGGYAAPAAVITDTVSFIPIDINHKATF